MRNVGLLAYTSKVLATIVREGMTVVLMGVVAGLVLALAAKRLVQHLLYGSADRQISSPSGFRPAALPRSNPSRR